MHELSVCQSIIAQVTQIAHENHAIAVTKIIVQIGPLSGIEAPLLEHAFPIASAGTIAQAARLETRILPIRVRCKLCGNENEATVNQLLCAACGTWQTSLLSGDEMLLKSIELEKSEEQAHV
ncbi:MAG: hydrogenase maturation nickel metallochaperone HypA [gamma proteobacterium symbiont of Bathyaustriella thionipta]|nr:hydrogenase maturation nickel metallochaperone HypA [gamma proteobacterium symbiont of Bathyaustriella thionipta]MCU7951117.1 hydrogenase maturation nickel metallochaperone HypA [gamma proteobacterium symbiont of Bathyaustriella thionipta]MCU7953326.1 hydrogenase maturation nickel metallochaperone HypA [gamma proteobacterium symbiont of Bathyaustriella thionipta]MCU7957632.1 hydrogenase maturation nickel metallochaperone HypA [gamma proteobacterium symbiont of Bathyaustriella thionipta]MCU79